MTLFEKYNDSSAPPLVQWIKWVFIAVKSLSELFVFGLSNVTCGPGLCSQCGPCSYCLSSPRHQRHNTIVGGWAVRNHETGSSPRPRRWCFCQDGDVVTWTGDTRVIWGECLQFSKILRGQLLFVEKNVHFHSPGSQKQPHVAMRFTPLRNTAIQIVAVI